MLPIWILMYDSSHLDGDSKALHILMRELVGSGALRAPCPPGPTHDAEEEAIFVCKAFANYIFSDPALWGLGLAGPERFAQAQEEAASLSTDVNGALTVVLSVRLPSGGPLGVSDYYKQS